MTLVTTWPPQDLKYNTKAVPLAKDMGEDIDGSGTIVLNRGLAESMRGMSARGRQVPEKTTVKGTLLGLQTPRGPILMNKPTGSEQSVVVEYQRTGACCALNNVSRGAVARAGGKGDAERGAGQSQAVVGKPRRGQRTWSHRARKTPPCDFG